MVAIVGTILVLCYGVKIAERRKCLPKALKVPDIAVDRESLSAAKVPLRCRLGLHDMKLVRWDIPGRLLKLRCRRCSREEMRDA